jgi:hypothetical protein
MPKRCGQCTKTKALSKFTLDKRKKDGLDRRCKKCKADNYAKLDKQKRREWRKDYYESHKEHELRLSRKYKKEHREYYKDYISWHYRTYPERGAAKTAKYRATKLNQTPGWITKDQLDEMIRIYENCPEGYHVDHIIPLQGREVKGLHVPWNLQYLPARINQQYGNRLKYSQECQAPIKIG